MNILWGSLVAIIGVLMVVAGTAKSEFIISRLMVARSRLLWDEGDAVPAGQPASNINQTAWQ